MKDEVRLRGGTAVTRRFRTRMWLSPPDVSAAEERAVGAAVRSGWVAPLGPEVDAFEADMSRFCGVGHAVALSSGSAALHLGLLGLGVTPGDEVVVPTMTFGATAFAVTYCGATPVFLDSERTSWNLDPDLLREFLVDRVHNGGLPGAIVTVDIFGRPCDYERILVIAEEFGIPVLADAAESLGAEAFGRRTGSFGNASVFSFNGNKIMTTSGGGMLVSDDAELIEKARFRSAQSREPYPWYEHEEIGFNYRMSNILAALGRVQLSRLPDMMARRRANFEGYVERLGDIEGIEFIGDPPWGKSNMWLTTMRFDLELHPHAPTRVRQALEAEAIESRPVWKPMHQQPVFVAAPTHLTGVADAIFASGLCLPSGSTMTEDDLDRVSAVVRSVLKS